MIVIQSHVRKWIAMAAYTKLQNERTEAAIVIQKNVRRYLAIRKLQCLKEVKAATTIQTFWRSRSARNQFLKLKNVTIVLQSYVRMRSARQQYENILGQRHYAAITIQKYLRRHLARKELIGLKRDKSAITIQTYWRGYAKKKQFLVLKVNTIIIQSHVRKWIAMTAYKNLLKKRNQAAITIQLYVRRHLAIKRLKFMKENNAATVIQTMWRTRFAKKGFVNLKNKTIIIQSYFRMWSARKTYQTTMNQRSEAAIVVQKCFRTFLAQKKLKCLREDKAATTIQAFWRCHSLRIKFLTLKNKTIIIQSYARMWSAMETYKIYLAVQKREKLRREKAATTIQAHWRGRVMRNEFLNIT